MRRELHLNEDFADFDTPIHEWTHVWWAWLKEEDPRMIERIVELMKQTKEFKAFRISAMTDKSSVYHGLSEEDMAQEVFARFMGKRGEDIMEQEGLGTWAKIRRYALDFFKGVMRTLGLSQEEVDSLTFEDVQNMCLRDLFDNETLGIKGLRLKINQRAALMDAIDNAAMDWSIEDATRKRGIRNASVLVAAKMVARYGKLTGFSTSTYADISYPSLSLLRRIGSGTLGLAGSVFDGEDGSTPKAVTKLLRSTAATRQVVNLIDTWITDIDGEE